MWPERFCDGSCCGSDTDTGNHLTDPLVLQDPVSARSGRQAARSGGLNKDRHQSIERARTTIFKSPLGDRPAAHPAISRSTAPTTNHTGSTLKISRRVPQAAARTSPRVSGSSIGAILSGSKVIFGIVPDLTDEQSPTPRSRGVGRRAPGYAGPSPCSLSCIRWFRISS